MVEHAQLGYVPLSLSEIKIHISPCTRFPLPSDELM